MTRGIDSGIAACEDNPEVRMERDLQPGTSRASHASTPTTPHPESARSNLTIANLKPIHHPLVIWKFKERELKIGDGNNRRKNT